MLSLEILSPGQNVDGGGGLSKDLGAKCDEWIRSGAQVGD
jgi:hypothetical protein